MSKKLNDVIVFGYGLAMFIPFFLMLHGFDHKLGLIRFVICVGLILTAVAKVEKFKPLYFVVLIGIYSVLSQQLQANGIPVKTVLWISAAVIFLILSSVNPLALTPVYDIWMKGAHAIGAFVTGVLLVVIFFIVFAPVGIVLRLFRKDLLDRSLQLERESYWHVRQPRPFEKENYQRQF